ncbi:hypothetical protein GOODEAATRI_010125, partial [Goodea atripinnis]
SGTLPESRHSSSSSSVSSGFQISMVDVAPMLQPHPAARPGELRECYYNLADQGVCSLLAANTSRQECCCTMGEGWGLDCQYHACPLADTAEFLSLCPSGRGYVTAGPAAFSYTDVDECKRFYPEVCKNGVCVNNIPGYRCYCSSGLVYNSALLECVDENLSVCWQHVSTDLLCQSPLLGAQVTFIDCCCFYGEGWGMGCALCPSTDSGELPGRDFSRPDYEDYPPAGGSRSGFRGRPPVSFGQPDEAYRGSEFSPGYYPEGDYGSPDSFPPRAPTFRLPPDPRSDIAFGAQPLSPSRPDSSPRNPAPLPGSSYEDREEEEDFRTWRPGSHFPPFDRSTDGGGSPRRVYERRYETHAGLNAAEDCGILHGCENGQCIRVAEGYTCDCYQGFELDMTSMTCIGTLIKVCWRVFTDINECEDSVGLQFPCVNARCVNTEGSFRCVCRRGYVMSRRRNHCIAA